jgi:NADH-quinone oxidoreductase subunit H
VTLAEIIFLALKCGLVFIPLSLIPLMIFLERKGAAVIQDRVGPNRSAITLPFIGEIRGFGFIHNFSDVVKLLKKEQFIAPRAHKAAYILGPMIPVVTAVLTPALIPWFGLVATADGRNLGGALIDHHAGLLLIFALSSLAVYGTVLGSWGSNSKMSLFGGLRASAVMISYEVTLGLSILGLVLIYGAGFHLGGMVAWQAEHTWGIIVQPVAFLVFVAVTFAETGRTPFDVKEGESEIVGGFHTEYAAIKFALYFMAEYAHVVIGSALIAVLFLGGYDLLPFAAFGPEAVADNLGYVAAGVCGALTMFFGFLAGLVRKQRRRYATFGASDAASKDREYGFFANAFTGAAIAALLAALLAVLLVGAPERAANGLHALWVQIGTALVQVLIVLAKTIFLCWCFVWVRWTVPRLRYDQIMGIGWKLLLNVSLVNLLVTAFLVKLLRG